MLSLVPPAAEAHLLKLFAAAEGTRIDGSVYYAGGRGAPGVSVVIRAPDGEALRAHDADVPRHADHHRVA